jgi:uncharacterized damage-inducible protein DinB
MSIPRRAICRRKRADRGAFFKSIHATLNHLLWADTLWISRLSDLPKPLGTISASTAYLDRWETLERERTAFDTRIVDWSDQFDAAMIAGDLAWRSVTLNADTMRPGSLSSICSITKPITKGKCMPC